LAAVRRELADLAQGVLDKKFTVSWAGRLVPGLEAEQAKLEQQEQQLTSRSTLVRFVGPRQVVTDRWIAAPLSSKREVARMVLSPGMLGQVRVGPSVNGPWCRDESHEKPQQTCTHRVLTRLQFIRE
jgi:site-specific DNA recombinase